MVGKEYDFGIAKGLSVRGYGETAEDYFPGAGEADGAAIQQLAHGSPTHSYGLFIGFHAIGI